MSFNSKSFPQARCPTFGAAKHGDYDSENLRTDPSHVRPFGTNLGRPAEDAHLRMNGPNIGHSAYD